MIAVWETRGHLQVLAHVEGQGQGGHGGTRQPHVRVARLPRPAAEAEAGLQTARRKCE